MEQPQPSGEGAFPAPWVLQCLGRPSSCSHERLLVALEAFPAPAPASPECTSLGLLSSLSPYLLPPSGHRHLWEEPDPFRSRLHHQVPGPAHQLHLHLQHGHEGEEVGGRSGGACRAGMLGEPGRGAGQTRLESWPCGLAAAGPWLGRDLGPLCTSVSSSVK